MKTLRETAPAYGTPRSEGTRFCVLDTSVVVGVLRRHPPSELLLADLERARAPVPVLTSVVRYEAERGVRSPQGRVRLAALLERTAVWPFTGEDAAVAGAVGRDLRERHQAIGDLAVLIAATALRRRVPLLTFNVRHFTRVPGLEVWDAFGGAGGA